MTLDPRSKLVLAFSAAVVLGTLDRWPWLLAAAGVLLAWTGMTGRPKGLLNFLKSEVRDAQIRCLANLSDRVLDAQKTR
jgi:hypothetical protein